MVLQLKIYAGNEENSLGSITDLSKVFEYDANKVFYTLVHLTDYGQKKIAEQIAAKKPKRRKSTAEEKRRLEKLE